MTDALRRADAVLRGLPWWRFAAGVASGAGALALTFLLRGLGLGLFLPEVAMDFAVDRLPGSVETFFIRAMGQGAKVFGLLVAVSVFLVLSGVYAIPYRRLQRRVRGRWALLGIVAAGYAAAVLLAVLPLLGLGVFGTASRSGAGFAAFSQILAGLLYAAILDHILVDVASRHPKGFHPSRRQFVVGLGILFFGAAIALAGLGALVARSSRLTFATVAELFSREQTSNAAFYRVTKNLIDPSVDVDAWRLTVDGLVASPSIHTKSSLEALANVSEFVTLECISNEVGGNLISTAKWTGVRLVDLIAASGPDPMADWVAFTCADGYTVGVPIARAIQPGSLLALRMNDAPLPPEHGSPARVVVPGLYGMFHAKWVERITLVRGEFVGYWQQKGWSNVGTIRATAIITTPPPDAVVQGPTPIAGVAFAGDRGISRVEVSMDDGATWQPVDLKTPPLSGLTWVLWRYDWSPASGSYRILARAFDGTGAAQESSAAPPFPDGAAGYDSIAILVA